MPKNDPAEPIVAGVPEGMMRQRRNADFVVPGNDGKEVCLSGFVTNIRNKSKSLKFIVLSDWTGDAQITFKSPEAGEEAFKAVDSMTLQSVVAVRGKVKKTEMTKRGVEVVASEVLVVTRSEPELPVDLTDSTESGFSKRLDWRFLDLRRPEKQHIFTLSSDFERFTRDFFYRNGFMEIHTPKLIGTASESGAELFELPYFGRKAYLAQSPQFYKQMAMCAGYEKVFEFGPVFRAEPSSTYRHASEFVSLDIEMSYISSFSDIMDFEEKWLSEVITKLAQKDVWGERSKSVLGVELKRPKFARIRMEEAYGVLEGLGQKVVRGGDLSSDNEKALGRYFSEEKGADMVFVTHYPSAFRPFYHMRPEDDQKLTYSFDLLYNGLEITTGAQREHRYEVLKQQAIEKGLNVKNIEFYLNFFKYGAPPHGGLGFGLSRMIMSLLRYSNVRETTFLHRDINRLFP